MIVLLQVLSFNFNVLIILKDFWNILCALTLPLNVEE